MKHAAFYGRFSSERQTEQSIEGQLRVCTEYAKNNGLEIVDTYIDRAMSGTNDRRDAFQQMLKDSEKPVSWDIVLVYAIDRFGRNSIEIAINKQKLKKNGKTLISATQRTSENIDGSKNLDGILLENVYIGLAEYYSAELSQKVSRGMHENRLKGFYCGGSIAFGYKVVNKKVCIDEDRAEIVRYVFSQYAEGKIVKEIKADLTAKGVTYKGKPFATNTLYDMLRAEKYIGIHRCRDGVYDNIYPAIIPKPLFEEVQRILTINKVGGKSVKTDFLLKGKVKCGKCGRNMQGESGTSRNGTVKYYYKCVGRKQLHVCDQEVYPKEYLEQIVTDTTLRILGNTGVVEQIADAVVKTHEKRMQDKSLLNVLQQDKEQTQKSLDNILKAIEIGILNSTTKARMDELEIKLQEINNKIAVEEHKVQATLRREQIIEYLTHTIRQAPKLILYVLVQKVIVHNEKIEIYYNYIDDKKTYQNSPDSDRGSIFIRCSTLLRNVAPTTTRTCCRFFIGLHHHA